MKPSVFWGIDQSIGYKKNTYVSIQIVLYWVLSSVLSNGDLYEWRRVWRYHRGN